MTRLEALESRRHFTVTAAVVGTTMQVYGDANDNTIWLTKVGTDLLVRAGQGSSGGVLLFDVLRAPDSSISAIKIWGSGGDDRISATKYVVDTLTVYGGTGSDTIQAGGGPSYLWGHTVVEANGFMPADDDAADQLIGGWSNDVLRGQGGDDTLQTSPDAPLTWTGLDSLIGGNGDDLLLVNGSAGSVVDIRGGLGNDKFRADYESRAQYVVFHGESGTDTVDYRFWEEGVFVTPDGLRYSGPVTGTRTHLIMADVETVVGTDYADRFSDGPGDNTYFCRGGADQANTGFPDDNTTEAGGDTYWGGAGNDSLYSGIGDDVVHGGIGRDMVYTSAGHDSVWGDDGDDFIQGGTGDDYIHGGAGADFLQGDTGSDIIDGRDGVAGNDRVIGSALGIQPTDWDIAYADRQFVVVGNSVMIVRDALEDMEEVHFGG